MTRTIEGPLFGGDEEKTPTVVHFTQGHGVPIRHEAPRVTQIGNMHDLLAHVPHCSEQLGALHAMPLERLLRLAGGLLKATGNEADGWVAEELELRATEHQIGTHGAEALRRRASARREQGRG